jgi:hypothetical protein
MRQSQPGSDIDRRFLAEAMRSMASDSVKASNRQEARAGFAERRRISSSPECTEDALLAQHHPSPEDALADEEEAARMTPRVQRAPSSK